MYSCRITIYQLIIGAGLRTPNSMVSLKADDESLFTMVSVYSLLGVVALLAVAHFSGMALLPAKTRKFDHAVFIWLVSSILPVCLD